MCRREMGVNLWWIFREAEEVTSGTRRGDFTIVIFNNLRTTFININSNYATKTNGLSCANTRPRRKVQEKLTNMTNKELFFYNFGKSNLTTFFCSLTKGGRCLTQKFFFPSPRTCGSMHKFQDRLKFFSKLNLNFTNAVVTFPKAGTWSENFFKIHPKFYSSPAKILPKCWCSTSQNSL